MASVVLNGTRAGIVTASPPTAKHLTRTAPKVASRVLSRRLATRAHSAGTLWKRALVKAPRLRNPGRVVVVSPANLGKQRDSLTQSQAPILHALKHGAKVIGLTTNGMESHGHPDLSIVRIDSKRMRDSGHISQAILTGLEELAVPGITHLCGVSVFGTAVPKHGDTLDQANIGNPRALMDAVEELGEEFDVDRVSLGHISSIAPTINGGRGICDYSDSRKKNDEEILKHKAKNGSIVVLTPGLILPDLNPATRFDTGRYWDIYTQAKHPIIFVIGSGDQIQQPVAEDELYEALYNGLFGEKSVRVLTDATGSEAITQKQMYKFFNTRAIGYAHIPYPLAIQLGADFPIGKLAGYSPKIFQTLDSLPVEEQTLDGSKFEELLGRKPKGMSELYPEGSYELPQGSSVWRQGLDIAGTLFTQPRKVLNLAGTAIRTLGDWSFSRIEDDS